MSVFGSLFQKFKGAPAAPRSAAVMARKERMGAQKAASAARNDAKNAGFSLAGHVMGGAMLGGAGNAYLTGSGQGLTGDRTIGQGFMTGAMVGAGLGGLFGAKSGWRAIKNSGKAEMNLINAKKGYTSALNAQKEARLAEAAKASAAKPDLKTSHFTNPANRATPAAFRHDTPQGSLPFRRLGEGQGSMNSAPYSKIAFRNRGGGVSVPRVAAQPAKQGDMFSSTNYGPVQEDLFTNTSTMQGDMFPMHNSAFDVTGIRPAL
jgi:hypothetical protein